MSDILNLKEINEELDRRQLGVMRGGTLRGLTENEKLANRIEESLQKKGYVTRDLIDECLSVLRGSDNAVIS